MTHCTAVARRRKVATPNSFLWSGRISKMDQFILGGALQRRFLAALYSKDCMFLLLPGRYHAARCSVLFNYCFLLCYFFLAIEIDGNFKRESVMPLRILVADDHEVVRRGLCAILSTHAGWEICADVADGREAVEKAKELKPDVVVLDIGMPSLNGLTAARQISHDDPEQKILILTVSDSEQLVREALEAGARGFVLKSDAARDLVGAVEALEHNRTFFTPTVNEMVLSGYFGVGQKASRDYSSRSSQLTLREREVVQLIAEGKSSKEVAVILNLSVKTAETHRSNIMRKLELHNLSELVLYAVRNGIIQAPLNDVLKSSSSSAA
jgi:DNA-binding NarL/FixJ family response regulator